MLRNNIKKQIKISIILLEITLKINDWNQTFLSQKLICKKIEDKHKCCLVKEFIRKNGGNLILINNVCI